MTLTSGVGPGDEGAPSPVRGELGLLVTPSAQPWGQSLGAQVCEDRPGV